MHRSIRIVFAFAVSLLLLLGCSERGQTPLEVDGLAPDKIEDASLSYADSTDDAYLTWTAPADGRSRRTVERYEIRYLYDGPFDWERAHPVIDPPLPASPGEKQSYRFRYPERGHALFMAVSSVGETGNPSPPSNTAYFHVPGFYFTGICLDVFTGAALAGIEAEIQGQDEISLLTTNAEGHFTLPNVPPQEFKVLLRSGGSVPAYFNMSRWFVLIENISHTFSMIPYQRSEVLPSLSLLQLFKIATNTTTTHEKQELLKWGRRPVRTYIPPFVNSAGVDYGETARSAVQRWMDRTGIQLFEFADAPPDTGVEFHYKPRSQMGMFVGVTRHAVCTDRLPLKDDIDIVDDIEDSMTAYRIMLHETGHTIQFSHLPNKGFIMYASHPLPDDISDDEAWLVRLLEALPNRTDMRIYEEVEP